MRLIGKAVLESAGAALESFDNARRNKNGAERRVAAGNSLPHQDDVGLNIPMLNGERFSGAAHAGHDFIGNQQDFIFAADFRDARDVTIGGHGSAEGGANDRLKNKRR